MISNLEREVRSLKDGFSPFQPTPSSVGKLTKRQRNPEGKSGKLKEKRIALQRSPRAEGAAKMSEALANSTPGCSIDETYMRRFDWPKTGSKTSSWPAQIDTDKISPDTKSVHMDTVNPNLVTRSSNRQGSRSKGIRIIENRQIVPPSLPSPSVDEWKRVGKRGAVRNSAPVKPQQPVAARAASSNIITKRVLPDKGKSARKLVRPAVVTISNKTSILR